MQDPEASGGPASRVTASRPDIVDRNGEVLATDIKTASLFAEPRRIVDADEAIEKIVDGPARPRLRADLQQAEERRRLRLAEASALAEAAERHHAAWHSGHRLPHREAPLLSGRRHRVAHPWPDQHRQPGHRRDREIHRRAGPGRPAGFRPCRCRRTSSRSGFRSISACSTSCATRLAAAMESYHAIAAGAVVLNVEDRRSGGDGVAAGLRSQQSVQCPRQGPPEPHVGGRVRDGLDHQELHHRDGARFRQGHA